MVFWILNHKTVCLKSPQFSFNVHVRLPPISDPKDHQLVFVFGSVVLSRAIFQLSTKAIKSCLDGFRKDILYHLISETNIAPEKLAFGTLLCFWVSAYFRGELLVSGSVISLKITQITHDVLNHFFGWTIQVTFTTAHFSFCHGLSFRKKFWETGCRVLKLKGLTSTMCWDASWAPVTVGSESFARGSLKISDGILAFCTPTHTDTHP